MFNDAENEVLLGIETSRQKNAKGQSVSSTVSSTARQKFTASIEKNSKLLTYYPTSKFVDDALLMIGKSYYYLGEDVKAERKFLELIAQYPDSKLIPEAKLWYGKSLLREGKTAEGVQQLTALNAQATEEGEDDVAGGAALAIGTYYFEQNDYTNALKYYAQSIESLGDGVENARTQFQIGLCYSKLGNYAAAEEAFHNVDHFKPDYNTTFQSALYESKMLTQQQKFNPALDILFDKLDDSKFADYAATAHREVGNTYAAEGNIAEAVAQYRYVDTAYARTDDAARSMFALASLYEHTLFQFDSARVYYDKARAEFSSSEITPAAVLKSESLTKYFSLRRDLANYDTLSMDIIKPGWRKKDSLTLVREDSLRRADSTAAVLKNGTASPSLAHAEGRDSMVAPQRRPPGGRDTSAGTIDTSAAASMFAHGDTSSTRMRLRSRQAVAAPLSAEARDSLMRVDSTARLEKARNERQKLDSLSRQIVRTKFELGGLLYLEMNRPDSALVYFKDVVRSTTDSSLAARAYFTMADIYRSADSASRPTVDSLYHIIIDIAPGSSYAQEARKNLGMTVQKEEKDSSEVRYLNAEQLLIEGRSAQAIPLFQSIAAEFPKSPYAPKALYAAGWIYENTLSDNDSAAAVYRHLASSYPSSTYATTVQPKLNELAAAKREAEQKAQAEKEEQARKEKLEKDKADAEKQKALDLLKAGRQTAADSSAAAPRQDSTKAGLPDSTSVRPMKDTTLPVPQDTTKPRVRFDSTSVRPMKDTTSSVPPDTTRSGRRYKNE